jgi:hypothetical protein
MIVTACLVLLLATNTSHAQPPILPDMVCGTDNGVNILSWTSQFDGLKSIAVQRSSDSMYNFTTVGYVKNLKKGEQGFIDGHPVAGQNWYKLYIVFNSDLVWYSNACKVFVDSAALLNKAVLPPNDSLQKLTSKIKVHIDTTIEAKKVKVPGTNTVKDTFTQTVKATIKLGVPEPDASDAYSYIKSQYVFTNPFTGHVNIEIPDAAKHKYQLIFYNQQNKKLFDIARITESSIIVDKRNFQKKGIFIFELLRDGERYELGYVTIY